MVPTLAPTHRLIHFETIDSTNAEAQRLASTGERGPLWIWADQQTQGRGRLGRSWVSERGNLYTTFLFTIAAAPALASQISFVAALAVFDVVLAAAKSSVIPDKAASGAADRGSSIPEAAQNLAPAHETFERSGILGPRSTPRSGGDDTITKSLALKWPNDVLLAGRKFSGILPEAIAQSGGETIIALGCGINLATAPQGTPYPVTAMAEHGISAGPAQCLELLSRAMATRLQQWRNGKGFATIRQAWLEHAIGLGGPAKAGDISGTFTGLAPDGALILSMPTGETRHIHAGEVRFAELDTLRASA